MRATSSIILLGLAMAVSLDGTSSNHDVCDDESAAKYSKLLGLDTCLLMKEQRIEELETEVRELQSSISHTQLEKEQLEVEINDTKTQNLEHLEASQSCDQKIPKDCCQIKTWLPSAQSGLYVIKDPCASDNPYSVSRLVVYCDMETDGGGWIVIQRRNASLNKVDFFRSWTEYENGFGDLDGEFWFGLKNIHELTFQHLDSMQLRLSVWNDSVTNLTYDYQSFAIAGPIEKYRVYRFSGGSGATYSPFAHVSTSYFSTYDNDNDGVSATNCVYNTQGAWWYSGCGYANLNGRHEPTDYPGVDPLRQRLVWRTNTSTYTVYTHSEMKIRPTSCGLTH